jgi:hypothetical protein
MEVKTVAWLLMCFSGAAGALPGEATFCSFACSSKYCRLFYSSLEDDFSSKKCLIGFIFFTEAVVGAKAGAMLNRP